MSTTEISAASYVYTQLDSIGLGPYLSSDEVSEVLVTPHRLVFVDRGGLLEQVQPSCEITPKRMLAAVEVIAASVGDTINRDKPSLNARLPDGSRVSAIIAPQSPMGTSLAIRKFTRHFSVEELIEKGAITKRVVDRVIEAIDRRENVVFSGQTSSGKTTMMNAHIQLIPGDARIITIEKPIELKITSHACYVQLEAVPAIGNHPEITVEQLLADSLRQRPDRIIIGEVRDRIAYDMLQAMNTGHSGTFSSLHADSASKALYRIAALAKPGFGDLTLARQETATAIQLVINVERDRTGKRAVCEVIEVEEYDRDNAQFRYKTIYSNKGRIYGSQNRKKAFTIDPSGHDAQSAVGRISQNYDSRLFARVGLVYPRG